VKYDLIVIGGGPGGLTAAWTAAAEGLKVLLLERRRNIQKVRRLCGQFTNINMVSVTGVYKYGYSEPLHLEIGTKETKVHWPAIGLSINYSGPIKPYINYIHFSPGGNVLYRIKDRFFGFYWEKPALLNDLLGYAEASGVDIVTGALVGHAENISDGVEVEATKDGKQLRWQARMLIAADGKGSKTADRLGLFKDRKLSDMSFGGVGFVVEGIDTSWGINSWLCFTVPSLCPLGNLWMYQTTGDRYVVGTLQSKGMSASDATKQFMNLPYFNSWFKNARIVDKYSFSGKGIYRPLEEPVISRILILGEAAGVGETSNPGAIACGYQGAKAVVKEINGKPGFKNYCDWWKLAFEGIDPDHGKAAARFFSLNSLCTDKEVDYLYKKFQGAIGVPAITIAGRLDEIKSESPELYTKLKRTGMDEDFRKMQITYENVIDQEV